MDRAGAAPNKKILIIHGVNYFPESSVKESVELLAACPAEDGAPVAGGVRRR